jgi:FAD dependent oxidoreductase
MTAQPASKTILEPAREIRVAREADVVVVGGGPGGFAAAVSAARSGAKTVLIERYGHLGGMATGGLVNIFPNLSDISGKQHIFGLNQEIIDRMKAKNAAFCPDDEDFGTTDSKVLDYYLSANMGWFFVRKDPNLGGRDRLLYTAVLDPEMLKAELDDMVAEAGVDLLLHSWGTRPIMEGDTAKGVIFESKSGRQAILAKVVIDSTGDGDIFVAAGAEFDDELQSSFRTALAFSYWIANVDTNRLDDFRRSHPDEFDLLMRDLAEKGGHPFFFRGLLQNQEGVIWFHPMHIKPIASDAMDVEELTRWNVLARRAALTTYEFLLKNAPGCEKCFIMQTAPQLGTQGGRRVIGEYILTPNDMESDEVFDDTIVVLANNDNGEISARHPSICIPYRCLVPRKIDGLLVACRAFSSKASVNQWFNIIPHCVAYGQAAGTAAALAVRDGIQPRRVDCRELQAHLRQQGVKLPE